MVAFAGRGGKEDGPRAPFCLPESGQTPHILLVFEHKQALAMSEGAV
jgi:hypothetical protein